MHIWLAPTRNRTCLLAAIARTRRLVCDVHRAVRPMRRSHLMLQRNAYAPRWHVCTTNLTRLELNLLPIEIVCGGDRSLKQCLRLLFHARPVGPGYFVSSSSRGGLTERNSLGVSLISGCSVNHTAALKWLTNLVSGVVPLQRSQGTSCPLHFGQRRAGKRALWDGSLPLGSSPFPIPKGYRAHVTQAIFVTSVVRRPRHHPSPEERS